MCAAAQLMEMSEARGSLAVAALNNLIFAIGGGCASDGGPMHNHESVEIFDPNLNTWTAGPNMAYARFTTACAALGGALYVGGGFNGTQYLNSVEMLDPRVGKWMPVRMLPQQALAVGKLYCTGFIGGHFMLRDKPHLRKGAAS
jgi:hypothetical protein